MPEYKKSMKKKSKKGGSGNIVRMILFWVIVLLCGSFIFNSVFGENIDEEEKSITEIVAYANDNQLEEIVVRGNELHVTPKESANLNKMYARKESGGTLAEQGFEDAIKEGKVKVTVEERVDVWGSIMDMAIIVVPSLLLVGFLFYMMRQAQNLRKR